MTSFRRFLAANIIASACSLATCTHAQADCSVIKQLRSAATSRFQTIQGASRAKDGMSEGEFDSTMVVSGAKCRISGDVNENYRAHECQWLLGRDQAEAQSIFDEMVSDTLRCLGSSDSPSRHSRKRGASISVEDGPKRSLNIDYGFDSRWYYVTLEYIVER